MKNFLAYVALFGLLVAPAFADDFKISQLPVPSTGSTSLTNGDVVPANRGGNTYQLRSAFGGTCPTNQFVAMITPQGQAACANVAAAQVTGLGTAAQANTGTSGATVPYLSGNNTWGGTQNFGTATATTQSANDNSTKLATDNYVDSLAFTTKVSWTPALKFNALATGITGSETGTYIKVGKFIVAEGTVVLTSKGSSTGNATITGLPFTANSSGACAFEKWANMSVSTSVVSGLISGTTMTIFLSGATSMANAVDTNFTNTTNLNFTCTYIAS